MISKISVVLFTFIAFGVLADVINDPKTGHQVRASCESYDISISPKSRFKKNVNLSNVNDEPAGFEVIQHFKSPYGDSYLKVQNPDFMVAPKEGVGWTSSIYLKHINGHELEITIKEHNSYGVTAFWRDNNTVIIEIWWGRIAQSIFRIGLSGELHITSEDRGHFEAILPCYKG